MTDTIKTDLAGVAADFALAVGGGDRSALTAMLAPDLEFRALTPARYWEIDSADEAVDTMLGTWFGGERVVESVESVQADVVADRARVGYRFRATTPDGPAVVEQQAYLTLTGATITAVRIICSGYRPVVG